MLNSALVLTLLDFNGWGPSKVLSYCEKHCFNSELAYQCLVFEFDEKDLMYFNEKLEINEQIIKDHQSKGIECFCILDEKFPQNLYKSTNPCVLLFYKGNIDLLHTPIIGIIGTRKPNETFILDGCKIASSLAKKGFTILSGLALGCDTIAHTATCDVSGKTIAVLPSPIDDIQPTSNKSLAERILDCGGLLISEYRCGTPFSKYHFPERDRIQSLLSNCLIVIEASEQSGTMIAVKKSLKDGKDVFQLEGNNNCLIQQSLNINDLSLLDRYLNK